MSSARRQRNGRLWVTGAPLTMAALLQLGAAAPPPAPPLAALTPLAAPAPSSRSTARQSPATSLQPALPAQQVQARRDRPAGLPCQSDELCFGNGQWAARVTWRSPYDGRQGSGIPVAHSPLAGFFAFDDPANLELMVKVLDFGDGARVFWSQLTDFSLELTLREVSTGRERVYRETPDRCGGIDRPFAGAAGAWSTARAPQSTTRSPRSPLATCEPAPNRLCLGDGRFAVEVTWESPYDGSRGFGSTAALSPFAGTVTFGDAENLELLVKVLSFEQRTLVFWGSLSDFTYTVRVTDTSNGSERLFRNPAGRFCGGSDPDAFGDPGLAIVGVDVLTMASREAPEWLRDQTIWVRGSRISAIGPRSEVAIPGDAQIVAGEGRVVLPGLIDMHVHLSGGALADYVAAGVTTVRNMWGWPSLPALVAAIERGERLGPSVVSASNGVDGDPPPPWPYPELITDATRAEALVARLHGDGWRFLKVYQSLSRSVYDALVSAAHRRGMPVVGHVSTRIDIEHALASGQLTVEHLSGYDRALTRRSGGGSGSWIDIDAARLPRLVDLTVAAGTWNCPTMAIADRLAQRSLGSRDLAQFRTNRALTIAALDRAGAGLLIGTDAGIDITAPGHSIHEELDAFVRAGIPPFRALRAATHDAALALGELAATGTLEVGKRADLLLVEGDPLADLGVLRHPIAVVLRGELVDGERHPAPVRP